MKICISLNEEQVALLKKLKLVRKTNNSNQIFREALYEYAEKFFPDSMHTGIKSIINDVRKEG
ncbi:MAG: ribbon-helix-helix protein, CopG family [Lentisphaerae bacterium]|jgi:hypothetical protein|nr:ribbon-helix-helix protein, CopG family [Lentisphaerota bacterium]